MFYDLFLIGFLFFAVLMLFIITSAFVGFLITRAPFVRTGTEDIEFIINKLNISSRDVFYDLGSGDGKVVFLVNQLTGARCVGFELTWWTHALSALKSKFINPSQSPLLKRGEGPSSPSLQKRGLGGVKFHHKDFFKADWQEANYIYAYLYPPLMGRIKEKFLAECKPGTIAIIRDFPLPGLKPTEVFYRPKEHEIYIYRK